MSSNDNLIVCADNNFKINDLFKVSPKNIVGDNTLPVSQQYKTYNFDKMSFMGSGEFTGIYYDDTSPNGQHKGNNLGCKGVYVIGVYSETKDVILNKEVTLYLSDKQLSSLPKTTDFGYYTWTDTKGNTITSLLRVVNNKITTFDNSFYTDKASLISHLKTAFSTINNNIKFSYTSNTHFTDSLQFVSFDETYCCAKFTWVNTSSTSFNSIFANDPGSYDTANNIPYSLRTYDTAIFSYDMLDFGVVEIYPTCFAVGTNNTAAGDGNIATGLSSKAMGVFSAAFGRSAQARGYSTFAAGNRSKALIEKSVALGDSCETRGTGSFAAGYQCITNNAYSVAMGDRCNVNATRSFAIGRKNNTNKDYSVAIGDECTTNAINSIALGTQNNTKGNYSVALGTNIITSQLTPANKQNQVIVGSYNCENISARFAVGGGTEINTKVVGKDGNTYTEIDRKNILEIVSDGKIIVPLKNSAGVFEGNYGYIELYENSSGNVAIRYGKADTTTHKRYKKVWRNNSTGVETETDPTI